ncbi:DUF7352 domain-containing protein [Vibrio parahaemolyticus]|uniref:DUF7352 domain-containing protein n=1 Tax=Vibrio parahaemolyticus TaxID=670 RepID=UPI000649CC84|nr:hypothetical protein [Vibrio parahaemolyticus]EII3125359.1 hypothetical protein [Vibrio parahaemolyticus]
MQNEMRRIFKYKLEVVVNTQLTLPTNSEILSVGAQGKDIFLWALIGAGQETSIRTFAVLPTGASIPANVDCSFLGTVHLHECGEVYHVFEDVTPDFDVRYEPVI